jgi:hypothetical protein
MHRCKAHRGTEIPPEVMRRSHSASALRMAVVRPLSVSAPMPKSRTVHRPIPAADSARWQKYFSLCVCVCVCVRVLYLAKQRGAWGGSSRVSFPRPAWWSQLPRARLPSTSLPPAASHQRQQRCSVSGIDGGTDADRERDRTVRLVV